MNTNHTTITRLCGANRNQPRLWLEGDTLARHGWTRGTQFNATFHADCFLYEKQTPGKRKVAGTGERPILDTNSKKLGTKCGFQTGDALTVVITARYIVAFNPAVTTFADLASAYLLDLEIEDLCA